MDLKRSKDVTMRVTEKCHGGEGALLCKNLLVGFESSDLRLMHNDFIPAGVSICVHDHLLNEEVYYLLSGKGTLTFDGKTYEMKAGDVSLCARGHSHGFLAEEDSVLIVVATTRDPQ